MAEPLAASPAAAAAPLQVGLIGFVGDQKGGSAPGRGGPRGEHARQSASAGDASRSDHRRGGHGLHDLGQKGQRSDSARVAAGFGALGHHIVGSR